MMKATNDNYIDALPHEVELYLFSFFDIEDLPNVAAVSKWWFKLTDDVFIWRKLYFSHFPYSTLVKNCIRQSGTNWRQEFKKARDLAKNWREGNWSRTSFEHSRRGFTQTGPDVMGVKVRGHRGILGSLPYRSVAFFHVLPYHHRSSSEPQQDINVVWNYATDKRVSCVDFNNDLAVAGFTDGTIDCLSLDGGEVKTQFERELQWVESIALDGNRIAAGYERDIGIFDLTEQKLVQTLMGHNSNVMAIQFDGSTLFSGSLDKKCTIWDLRTGDAIHSVVSNAINTLQYDPSRCLLATGCGKGLVTLWDTRMGMTHSLSAHALSPKAIQSLRFQGDRLIIGTSANALSVVDMKGMSVQFSIPHSWWVRSVNFDDTTITCSSSNSVFRYHFD